jgi:hypothetical protein
VEDQGEAALTVEGEVGTGEKQTAVYYIGDVT